MDEIDRELKQIQLQRERLALKRDLERSEWKTNTLGIAGRVISYGIYAVRKSFLGIVAFVRRRWKLPALLVASAAVAYGGLAWKEMREQAKLETEQTKYRAELKTFVTARCLGVAPEQPELCSNSLGYEDFAVCVQRSGHYRECASEASGLFSQRKNLGNATAVIGSVVTVVADPAEVGMPVSAIGVYVVQVGQFTDAVAARNMRLKLEKLGMKTYTQVANTAGDNTIHVRVGPFGTRADADKAAVKIKSVGVSSVVLDL